MRPRNNTDGALLCSRDMAMFKLNFAIKSVEYSFRAVEAGRGQDDDRREAFQSVSRLRIFEGAEKQRANH